MAKPEAMLYKINKSMTNLGGIMIKKNLLLALLLVGAIVLNSSQVGAWYAITAFEASPAGHAGQTQYTPIVWIDYTHSSNWYLYRSQLTTQIEKGIADMPWYFTKYTERGGHAFTDSVADISNPSSYIIANSHWTEFEIESGTGYYRPLKWHPLTMPDQLVETSGVVNLRIRFIFDVYGTDQGTAFPQHIFDYRYIK